MDKVILFTNEDELNRLKEFEKKKIYEDGLTNTEIFYFTNDKNKTRYYPIKITMKIEKV